MAPDNVDLSRAPVHAGKLKWKTFLVSFMVDARGGAMRGCRHSGVRVIIPPRRAPMPMRITCRYLRKEKLAYPPPLMEGEACASRILEVGPSGAKFLGPVVIEVPHFASLRGREREITILRSDNGETWHEHTLEASEDAVHDVFNESFEGEELTAREHLSTDRITRILTTDFPQYFAIITRIRQEVHVIGPEGGMVSSTVVPQVQVIFPEGALTKKIKVGLQAQPITPELVTKLLGNRVAVSPILTVEPRRRKFHKPITLTIPVPQAATKGMINQYSGDAPTLRLLCSITGTTKTGGTTKAQWEDVTGSTPLTFVNDCVSFTTTVSARFWLIDCRQVNEATKFATELYREAIHVPFMAKFVVFAKRHDPLEAQLRVFCMTDDKEDKTLESQEHFTEVAKSRDVEVLEGKLQYLEFAGNLVPVTKSGEQLSLTFQAFRENRLPFTIRVKDPHQEPMGRVAFMREARVGRGDIPQSPICNLNIVLPEADLTPVSEMVTLEKKYGFVKETSLAKPELIHRADLRLSDIAKELRDDWVLLALQLDVSEADINTIRSDHPHDTTQQAHAMLRHWLHTGGHRATGNFLEKGLRKINREDIVNNCMFNVELVTDDVEKAVAKVHLDQSGFDTFKEELGPSRDASLRRDISLNGTYDEQDIMKDAESAAESSSESSDGGDRHAERKGKVVTETVIRTSAKVFEETPETLVQGVPSALSEAYSHTINGQMSDASIHDEDQSEPTVATLSSEATAEMEVSSLDDKSQGESHVEKKEWTETDESGGIRQITQIKTETSIKLEGEGARSSLKKVPKKEPSDDRKSSTDSEQEDLGFSEKKSMFQRLSITSDTLPKGNKCLEEVSLDDLPMAHGEIIHEQISFHDKLKMFEPDEDNRKKIQKRDKIDQPNVYKYDFTKSPKEKPVASEVVFSELEKAEEIVKQVSKELSMEEDSLNDPNFDLSEKNRSRSEQDSAFTLERVEQEVSSLLAEVDKEEKELSNDMRRVSCSRTDSDKSSNINSHIFDMESEKGNGSSDYAALSPDIVQESLTTTESHLTYSEVDVMMQDGERVTVFEGKTDTKKSFDGEQCMEMTTEVNAEDYVTTTQDEPIVESPSYAFHEKSSEQAYEIGSEGTAVYTITEESSDKKINSEILKRDEFKEAVKLDEDESEPENLSHADRPSNLLDISSVDSHIKSEILREEIDQSLEESPLEVKRIAEDLENMSSSEDHKRNVYKHIRTEIFTQVLGEDIESGSPERKEISLLSPKDSFNLSEDGEHVKLEALDSLESHELNKDKIFDSKSNLEKDIDKSDASTKSDLDDEENKISKGLGLSPQISLESAGQPDEISSEAVEPDEHMVDYEEAFGEHSLTEQLKALASDSAHIGFDSNVETSEFDIDHKTTAMSSSMSDLEIQRRAKELYSTRHEKKEIRSLKSTKQVSTIEEHSSIESCDSPQDFMLHDSSEKHSFSETSEKSIKSNAENKTDLEKVIPISLDSAKSDSGGKDDKDNSLEEKSLLDAEGSDKVDISFKISGDTSDKSERLSRSDSKSSQGKKSDSDAEGSKEGSGKRKEESFSSSGETESPYYSVETSDSGRTPRSTPAASRPCSSEYDINVFSGQGSEYETCVTSQGGSGSYITAISSQEVSYATACSSFSHSSRESAYSVDSESSGNLASIEQSSEASETLVPPAQEMELEFGPGCEMPVLEEEPSGEDVVKEPYDMDIPESVIRSGIEMPFMRNWGFEESGLDDKDSQLPQQWSWQYAAESEVLDKFEVLESDNVGEEQNFNNLPTANVETVEGCSSHVTTLTDTAKSFSSAETISSGHRTYSSLIDFVPEKETVEQPVNVEDEQLSVSESSAAHSEQTWQTNSVDTAVQLSSQAPASCVVNESSSLVSASDSFQETPPDKELTPEQSSGLQPESYLQLNGPVEVDYNPDYDNPDADNSELNQEQQVPGYEADGLQFDLEIDGTVNAISNDSNIENSADNYTNGVVVVDSNDSAMADSFSIHPSVEYEPNAVGTSSDAEKPEAQQELSLSFNNYDVHRDTDTAVCPDFASYLPESDQCDLLSAGDSLPPSYESEVNIPCSELASTNGMPTVEHRPQSLSDLQNTDSGERVDVVDTSPEDERYEYRSINSTSKEKQLEEKDFENDYVPPRYSAKYDDSPNVDLYTHREEDEFESRSSDVYPSPIPSYEDDKQSTPSSDVLLLHGRRFLNRSQDTSAASSLQEFERLEADIAAGRLSRSSIDSNERIGVTKSGEHDDVSMNSLTEFEKIEKELIENEGSEKVPEEMMLSEIEEGIESQSSDILEVLPESFHESEASEYEKRRLDIEELIKVTQSNVEKFQEETLSDAITSDECTVLARVFSESQDNSEDTKGSSKDGGTTDVEESEQLTMTLEGGHDSSSSGEKNHCNGKNDCMLSSTDSIDPSSSTATHATYQFETDSVVSSSINSAQASGEECTMVSSTDTLEPEPKLTYTQGDLSENNKQTSFKKESLDCKIEELRQLETSNGAKEQMERFLSKLTDETVLMDDFPSHSFSDTVDDSEQLASDELQKSCEAGQGISMSGDDFGIDGDDVISRRTTTTTRIVTTINTDGEEESHTEEQVVEEGDDLRHSVEVILNQFMSNDSDTTKPEDSTTEHDE